MAPVRLAIPDEPPARAVLANPVVFPDTDPITLVPAFPQPGGDLDVAGVDAPTVIVPLGGKIRALEPPHLENAIESGIGGETSAGRRPSLRARRDAAKPRLVARRAGDESLDRANRRPGIADTVARASGPGQLAPMTGRIGRADITLLPRDAIDATRDDDTAN